MAVALDFTYIESNDCLTFEFTDNTGAYDASTNTGGWGAPNELVSNIVLVSNTTVGKYHLTLGITHTDSSGTETTFDDIDLYSNFTSEFSKSYGMVYTLNMAHLKISGASYGTADTEFPDGLYDIVYTITNADDGSEVSSITYTLLADGNIRNKVYDRIINTSDVYKQKQFNAEERDWQDLLDGLFTYAYFTAMLTDNDDSSRDEKIEMLYFLEQKLINY